LDYFEVHLPEGACRLRIFCRLGEGAQDAPAYLVWSPVTIRIYSGNHPLPLVFPTGKITPPTLSFQTLELDIGGETCYVEFGPPQYDLDVLHNPVSMPNSKIGMVVQDQHLHRRFVDGVVPGGYSAQMLTKYLVWLALQWFIHRYRRHPDVANPADVKRVNDHLVNEILRQNVKTFDFWLPYWRVQENILEYLELFCNPMYVRYSRPATLITVTPETAQMATEAPLLPSRMFLQMYEYNPLAEAGRRLQVAAEANTLSYTFDPAGRTFICFKIKAYMQKSENDPIWPETSEFQGWYAKPFVGGEERFDKVYGGSRAYIEVSETRIRLCSPDREVSFPHPKGFDEPWNMVSLDEVKISLPDEIMILKFLPFRWGEDLNDLLDPAPWNSFEKNIKDHYIACNKEKWIFPRYVCYKSEDPNIPALKMSAEEFARNAYMSLIPKHIAKFRLNRTIICGHMLGVLRMEFEKSFSPRVFNYLVDNGIYQPADWINTFKQMFGFGIRVYPRGWCSGSRRDEDGAAGGGGGGGGARGGGGDGGRGDGGWGGGN
jgi:hypothetical protein